MKTKRLTFIAMMIALAIVLEFLSSRFFDFFWPAGGHPTLSAIPIVILAWKEGLIPAILGATLVGVLQFEPYIVSPIQYILDYPLAFACVGCSAFLVNILKPQDRFEERMLLSVSITIALIGRYICHVLSGLIFFSDAINVATVTYSLSYNAFIFMTIIITLYVINIGFNQFRALKIK